MSTAAAHSALFNPAPQLWRGRLVICSALLAWVGALYWDTAVSMVTIWMRSETFTHCLVIPPIVAWLIWRLRTVVGMLRPTYAGTPLILLAMTGFAWLLGELTAVNAVTQLAFVAFLVLVVPAVCGWRVTKAIVFPLGFMFLAVPIGEFVMPYMMENTADFTVAALQLSGIPVYREGLQFMIPTGNWSVVEACSGVRYLIASFTVGLLFAYLNYRTLSKRLAFVAVSIAVPVVANWLRAYMIVMLGHFSGNKLATGVDHIIYGWVFFGVVIIVMFMIGARWSDDMSDQVTPQAQPEGTIGGDEPASFPWQPVLFALLVGLPALANHWILRGESAKPATYQLPTQAGEWRMGSEPPAQWKPAFEGASAEAQSAYSRQGTAMGVYVGYYRNQDYRRKLVSSTNVMVQSQDKSWARVSRGVREVPVAGRNAEFVTGELRAHRAGADLADERLVVWQTYWVNGHLTASDRNAKLLTAIARLTGAGDDSAVIFLYTRKAAPGAAEERLAGFAAEVLPAIEKTLVQAKESR